MYRRGNQFVFLCLVILALSTLFIFRLLAMVYERDARNRLSKYQANSFANVSTLKVSEAAHAHSNDVVYKLDMELVALRTMWKESLLEAYQELDSDSEVGGLFLKSRGLNRRIVDGEFDLCGEYIEVSEMKKLWIPRLEVLLAEAPEKYAPAVQCELDFYSGESRSVAMGSFGFEALYRLVLDEFRRGIYCGGDPETIESHLRLLTAMLSVTTEGPGGFNLPFRGSVLRMHAAMLMEYFSSGGDPITADRILNQEFHVLTWDESAFQQSWGLNVERNLRRLNKSLDGETMEIRGESTSPGWNLAQFALGSSEVGAYNVNRYLSYLEREPQKILVTRSISDFLRENSFVNSLDSEFFYIGAPPVFRNLSWQDWIVRIESEWDNRAVLDLMQLGLQMELYRKSYGFYPQYITELNGKNTKQIPTSQFLFATTEDGYRIEYLHASRPTNFPVWEIGHDK